MKSIEDKIIKQIIIKVIKNVNGCKLYQLLGEMNSILYSKKELLHFYDKCIEFTEEYETEHKLVLIDFNCTHITDGYVQRLIHELIENKEIVSIKYFIKNDTHVFLLPINSIIDINNV